MKLDNKLEQLLSLLKDMPNEPFILFALAQECAKKGIVSEALKYYERIVETSPGYTGTYYHLGKLYEELGRKDDALSVYKKGMEITQKKGDHHALSELQSALSLISDED